MLSEIAFQNMMNHGCAGDML